MGNGKKNYNNKSNKSTYINKNKKNKYNSAIKKSKKFEEYIDESFEKTSQMLFDFDNNNVTEENEVSFETEENNSVEVLEEPVKKKNNKRKKYNDLDVTTRIRIDDERLNDTESLDTSFLEGRFSRKKTSKIIDKTPVKHEEEKKVRVVEFKEKKKPFKSFVTGAVIVAVILAFIGFGVYCANGILKSAPHKEVKAKVVTKEKIVNDENILFLGDSITELYDLDKYYKKYHVVNSGVGGNCTTDILDDMYGRVYRYNPSKVFLLIGTNDMVIDSKKDDIIGNVETIIRDIKKNRKYAEIYLESIYPINNTDDEKINERHVGSRTNTEIRELNKELKRIAKEQKITYIDMYDILIDEDNQLDIDYTDEGLHISEEGYDVITDELMKYIKDEK